MGPEPPISFFQSSQSRELNTVQQSQISTQESMTSDTFTKYDEQNTSSSQAWRDPSQPPSNIRDDSQSRSQSQMLAAEVDDAVHLDNDGHEDNKAADTDDDTGTHYSSLSGAASWAKFREEVGGRTIGSSLATDQGHEIMNLYDDIREFVVSMRRTVGLRGVADGRDCRRISGSPRLNGETYLTMVRSSPGYSAWLH